MAQVEEIKFEAIPENTLTAGVDLDKLKAMGENLTKLAAEWNALATVGSIDATIDPNKPNKIAAAHKALKDSKLKIVDLNKVELDKTVFLGGSRKRRQSKKRRNQRNHNNNQ